MTQPTYQDTIPQTDQKPDYLGGKPYQTRSQQECGACDDGGKMPAVLPTQGTCAEVPRESNESLSDLHLDSAEEEAAEKCGMTVGEYRLAQKNWASAVRDSADDTDLADDSPSALDSQVGGDHYRGFSIQPVEFSVVNKLGFAEGNIVKYACRHTLKGGSDDMRKVIHYARIILETVYGESE